MNDELLAAAKREDFWGVQSLLAEGASVNHADDEGNTTLHDAVHSGRAAIVRLLIISHGASINHEDNYGYTALHEAASCGHEGTVRLLLQEGASIDHPDNHDYTPLHQAASHGYEAVVKLLLEKGVAINHQSNYGDTALHHAARHGAYATLTLLLEQGALIRKCKSEHTPLHDGVLSKRTDAVKLLLRHGVYAYHQGPDEIFNKYWKELVNTDESQLSLCMHLLLGGVNIPKEVDLPEWLAKPKGLIDKTISEWLAPLNLSETEYGSVIPLILQMLPRLLKWVEATHKAMNLPDDAEIKRRKAKKLPPRDMDALDDLLSVVKVEDKPLQSAHNQLSTAMLQALKGNALPKELVLLIQDVSIAETLVTGLKKCYPNIPPRVAEYLVDAMMTDHVMPPPKKQYPNFYKTLFTHHWKTPLEAPITRTPGLRP